MMTGSSDVHDSLVYQEQLNRTLYQLISFFIEIFRSQTRCVASFSVSCVLLCVRIPLAHVSSGVGRRLVSVGRSRTF